MDEKYGVVATPVLHLMKKSIRRMFILLIIFITLFVISVIDSIYQRCRIIDLLESFEVVKSHLDSNNHVNNGQYIAMAAAYVPEGFVTGSLRAEYKMQARLGDVMVPHVGKTDNGVTVSLRSQEGSVYCNVEFVRA